METRDQEPWYCVVIILIVLGALFVWPGFARNGGGAPGTNTGGTNINVTVPTPGGDAGAGSGAGTAQ